MRKHVDNICRAGWAGIRRIGKIRKYLDEKSTEKLTHAFITQRIDNCNSLLQNLPDMDIQKLQRLQNATARLVCRVKRSEHITPILYKLHWLPVYQRIKYKTLLLAFKCLHNLAPAYLCELIARYQPKRKLRSSALTLIDVQTAKLVTYGDRAFAVTAPSLWNQLPEHIRGEQSLDSFKSKLKTHLFNQHFNQFK